LRGSQEALGPHRCGGNYLELEPPRALRRHYISRVKETVALPINRVSAPGPKMIPGARSGGRALRSARIMTRHDATARSAYARPAAIKSRRDTTDSARVPPQGGLIRCHHHLVNPFSCTETAEWLAKDERIHDGARLYHRLRRRPWKSGRSKRGTERVPESGMHMSM
jgi:hypothetical protein